MSVAPADAHVARAGGQRVAVLARPAARGGGQRVHLDVEVLALPQQRCALVILIAPAGPVRLMVDAVYEDDEDDEQYED
jgi:hypothetical protein